MGTRLEHEPKHLRVDISNCGYEDFENLRWTITAAARCRCEERFVVTAKIPKEMAQDDEFMAELSNRLSAIADRRRNAHIARVN